VPHRTLAAPSSKFATSTTLFVLFAHSYTVNLPVRLRLRPLNSASEPPAPPSIITMPSSSRLPALLSVALLLLPAAASLRAAETTPAAPLHPVAEAWVDVSHSLGFPLGGLGTGYVAFGQYGFVREFFDGREPESLAAGTWEYTAADAKTAAAAALPVVKKRLSSAQAAATPPAPKALARLEKAVALTQAAADRVASPAGFVPSSFGFVVRDIPGETVSVVQTTPALWLPEATPFQSATASALPPKGRVVFTDPSTELKVTINAFAPLLPHDLAVATLPVIVCDVTVENTGVGPRNLALSLEHSIAATPVAGKPGRVLFTSKSGQLAFDCATAEAAPRGLSAPVFLSPGGTETLRFYIAWHYPKVEWYKRYYTLAHADTGSVLDLARRDASAWSKRIDAWQASFDVPAYLRRIWFGSLSSIVTSSIMTADPYFLEVETPHWSVNTMDVCVYSNWAYLVNWPELERMDMNQFFKSMKTEGPQAGLVWHSLWNDAAKYVEEPTFLVRLRRADLWFNDPAWTRVGYPHAVRAARRVFTEDNQDGLVVSKHGNQSYDVWRMPGISSYVNSAWVYGLESLDRIAASIGEPAPDIAGEPLAKLIPRAYASYDRLLWNDTTKNWNLFFRTEGADKSSTPETLFTDQLFGRWVVGVDRAAFTGGLPEAKIKTALQTLYTHNLAEDPAQNFRGWANGMKPGRIPDTTTGYHAKTFWFGPQINLGSLLGLYGDEAASLDVIRSVSDSLGKNALAAGEWNRSLDKDGTVVILSEEFCKDTPRFAPYPRYKSSWEYVVRLVGLTLDEKTAYFAPFKTVDFAFHDIALAGLRLDITVQSGWTRALVDGKPAKLPLTLPRTVQTARLEFLR